MGFDFHIFRSGAPLVIDIENVPEILAPFIKGKIEATAKFIDASGNENICVKTTLELD